VAESASLKPVIWIGSSRSDLRAFPKPVKDVVGYALYVAQQGGKHPDAKPLHGFGGAGVLEILEDYRGDTYRAVYTVRLAGRVYALHAFQKKAKVGIKTPKPDIDLIRERYKRAEEQHEQWTQQVKARETS
jgi:phage-related protein